MNTLDISARDFFQRPCNHKSGKNVIQFVRIINILRSLSNTKDRNLLRKVRIRKKVIPLVICGDRLSIIRIPVHMKPFFNTVFLTGSVIMINRIAPRNHVERIVVGQFQLRRKLTDIIPRTCTSHLQLETAATKTIQHRLRAQTGWIRHLVALIKAECNILIMNPYPALYLFTIFAKLVQCDEDKISTLYLIKISKLVHHDISDSKIREHDIPCVLD